MTLSSESFVFEDLGFNYMMLFAGSIIRKQETITPSSMVEDSYDIVNGISGFGRDVILRLFKLFWHKWKAVRAIIGMSQEHLPWIRHSFFIQTRPNKITASLVMDSRLHGGVSIASPSYLYTSLDWKTVFLSSIVTKGIVRWTVKPKYAASGMSSFWLGIAPADRAAPCDCLGDLNGASSFNFFKYPNGVLGSILCGVRCRGGYYTTIPCVPNNALVAVEVDCQAHTLSFFVNESRVPCSISGVRLPVQIGLSGGWEQSFSSVCFCRLHASTPSSVLCHLFRCG